MARTELAGVKGAFAEAVEGALGNKAKTRSELMRRALASYLGYQATEEELVGGQRGAVSSFIGEKTTERYAHAREVGAILLDNYDILPIPVRELLTPHLKLRGQGS